MVRIYSVLQGFYQICISVWFGGAVMFAIAAGVTFKKSRALDGMIGVEEFQGPLFVGDEAVYAASDVFAGQIVGGLVDWFTMLVAICVVYIAFFLALEATTFRRMLKVGVGRWLRLVFLVIAIVLFLFGAGMVHPGMKELNSVRYSEVVSVEVREQASDDFKKAHRMSERLVGVEMLLLLGVFFTGAHRGEGAFGGKGEKG